MGYADKWGEWHEGEPDTEPVKPALWVKAFTPKKVQSSIPLKHQLTREEMRLGGQKGGISRRNKLSPERRREIAQKAAQTRWHT